MSEALIASLNTRVSDLQQQAANLKAALKEARGERSAAVAERDTLRAELAKLATERDDWKGKAEAAPSQTAETIAKLQQQLRTRDHRDAFRARAASAGVRPEAVDDLYALSGLAPPESGDVTPESFDEYLGAAKTSRAWAFGVTPEPSGQNGTSQGVKLPATPPPAGAGRSASAPPDGRVQYTADEVRRPGWQKARPELVTALAEGRAVCLE